MKTSKRELIAPRADKRDNAATPTGASARQMA